MLLRGFVVPTTLPPVWAKPTGLHGPTSARITTSDFVSPALHIVHAQFYDTELPEDQRPDQGIKTAHIPTPATETETHYFGVHGRNFALGEEYFEISLKSDLASVAMRRYLKRRADAEQAALQEKPAKAKATPIAMAEKA